MPYTLEDRERFGLQSVENLSVGWIEQIPHVMFVSYRKLRRTNLLRIYSMQVQMLNTGKCDSDAFCSKCPVMKLEDQLTGWGGALACSLVRSILSVELGFYKRRIASESRLCDLCGDPITVGRKYVYVELFGLESLRICSNCVA